MMAHRGKKKVERAFSEVKANEPAIVAQTRRKKGAEAARKQKIAIALSKARKAGAHIPKLAKKSTKGSPAFSDADIKRGYKVL